MGVRGKTGAWIRTSPVNRFNMSEPSKSPASAIDASPPGSDSSRLQSSSAPSPPSPVSNPLSPVNRVGAVILAAGASARMGSPKQLLKIEGKPLLVRAVEAALASPVWPVVVVLGANAERIRPVLARFPVLITENASWPEGMAASIRAGVTTLQQFSRHLDAALLALCDQPAFSAATIAQLIELQRTSSRGIVAARYSGRNGAPALFLRQHFAELTALTGEEGARALLNADPSRVAAIDLPALAMDLDTVADVAALNLDSGVGETTNER
jgi:molybdenum cofactor cytidylyltransferase